MDETINSYLTGFDEVNVLSVRLANSDIENEALRKENKDAFDEFLIDAYLMGFEGAKAMLGDTKKATADKRYIKDSLDKKYSDGETVSEKFQKAYESQDQTAMQKLCETEYHRVYNQGSLDYATVYGGKRVEKTWCTMLDDKVREQHEYLEGVTVPIDAEFVSAEGYKAQAPGMFNVPELDINCRCILRYKRV